MDVFEGGNRGFFEDFGRMERQLMRGFGGLDNDFFGSMMGHMDSPFDSMFNFSDSKRCILFSSSEVASRERRGRLYQSNIRIK